MYTNGEGCLGLFCNFAFDVGGRPGIAGAESFEDEGGLSVVADPGPMRRGELADRHSVGEHADFRACGFTTAVAGETKALRTFEPFRTREFRKRTLTRSGQN